MPKLKDRVPLYPAIDPQASAGFFTDGGIFSSNAMLERYSDGQYYVTQRPGLDIIGLPDVWSITDPVGRGTYYWEKEGALYTVVSDTVFSGQGSFVGNISLGMEPVWMGELGDYLIIIDHENNQGWTVDGGGVLTQITDPDFPTSLAGGGAILNGILYVLAEDGTIYNSDFNDPTSWNALDFINAEREPDGGSYITKYLDHVVVFGHSTIEFFYDAANPVGSPLARREDISYRTGGLDAKSVYNSGDVIFFLSTDVSGSIQFKSIENFRLNTLSTPQIDRYIEARRRASNVQVVMSGSHVAGHLFVYMTFAVAEGNTWLVQETLTYDYATQHFSEFDTKYPGIDFFPVASWTVRQGPSVDFSFGLMLTGHVVRWSGSVVPIDQLNLDPYFAPGYITQGYISNLTGTPEPILYVDLDYVEEDYVDGEEESFAGQPLIEMVIRTELWNAKAVGPVENHNKFIHKLEVVGARLAEFDEDPEPMFVRWTDDNYNSYSEPRPVAVGGKQRLTSCGKTVERAFEISYAGVNRIRVENLSLTFGVSSYA